LLIIGPALSNVVSANSVAVMRGSFTHMQFLGSMLHIRLLWPREFVAAFKYIEALVDAVQLAAPECYASAWSCA
jgi:hypothetical protein